MEKEDFSMLFGFLAIIFCCVFVISLFVGLETESFILMRISIIGSILFAILWFVFKIQSDEIKTENEKVKKEEEQAKKKAVAQKKEEELTKAYNEISDIWPYGNKVMLAITPSEETGFLSYIQVKYSFSGQKPWIISVKPADKEEVLNFKAERKGNNIVGVDDDKIAIMKQGQLVINDLVFYFDLENEYVNKAKKLMKCLCFGKKIKVIRLEHLQSDDEILDLLPKYHFVFSEKGIICDEINYPKKHLDEFFEKNEGGERIYQNKIFYAQYLKKGKFYAFEDQSDFNQYLMELSSLAHKPEFRGCKIDFDIANWYAAVNTGLNALFASFKQYVSAKTLDVVPAFFYDNTFVFKHKEYKTSEKKSLAMKNVAILEMQIERKDKNEDLNYYITLSSDEHILIVIGEEKFISVNKIGDI